MVTPTGTSPATAISYPVAENLRGFLSENAKSPNEIPPNRQIKSCQIAKYTIQYMHGTIQT